MLTGCSPSGCGSSAPATALPRPSSSTVRSSRRSGSRRPSSRMTISSWWSGPRLYIAKVTSPAGTSLGALMWKSLTQTSTSFFEWSESAEEPQPEAASIAMPASAIAARREGPEFTEPLSARPAIRLYRREWALSGTRHDSALTSSAVSTEFEWPREVAGELDRRVQNRDFLLWLNVTGRRRGENVDYDAIGREIETWL